MIIESFVCRATRVNIVCGVERKSNEGEGISETRGRLYMENRRERERKDKGGNIVVTEICMEGRK